MEVEFLKKLFELDPKTLEYVFKKNHITSIFSHIKSPAKEQYIFLDPVKWLNFEKYVFRFRLDTHGSYFGHLRLKVVRWVLDNVVISIFSWGAEALKRLSTKKKRFILTRKHSFSTKFIVFCAHLCLNVLHCNDTSSDKFCESVIGKYVNMNMSLEEDVLHVLKQCYAHMLIKLNTLVKTSDAGEVINSVSIQARISHTSAYINLLSHKIRLIFIDFCSSSHIHSTSHSSWAKESINIKRIILVLQHLPDYMEQVKFHKKIISALRCVKKRRFSFMLSDKEAASICLQFLVPEYPLYVRFMAFSSLCRLPNWDASFITRCVKIPIYDNKEKQQSIYPLEEFYGYCYNFVWYFIFPSMFPHCILRSIYLQMF